jgi:abhydrolase domain-containing protein 5
MYDSNVHSPVDNIKVKSRSSTTFILHQFLLIQFVILPIMEVQLSPEITAAGMPHLKENNNKSALQVHDEEEERCASSWLKWRPTSKVLLREAEESILSYAGVPYKGFYVNVGPVVGKHDSKIWTLSFNTDSPNTPLVLVHGMGAGSALWVLNFKQFAETRPVYAIDILGFGRSSRPSFSSDAKEAESELVASIEAWRQKMKLEKFVLVGHSLGGYLVTSYTIKYPDPVAHLILADPWGFKDKGDLSDHPRFSKIPNYVKILVKLFEPLNPLWALRAAGPMGPKLIQRMRSDLQRRYECLLEEDAYKISMYLYHSNAQNPAGESAFHAMMDTFGWAKHPMHYRLPNLDENVPMTLLYGRNSWVDHFPSEEIVAMRQGSQVDAHIIEGAGHHIYADGREDFNDIVLNVCKKVDSSSNNRR